MKIAVLFFGMVKEITGGASTTVEMEEGSTVEALFERFAGEFPALRPMSKSLVLAVNQRFVARTQSLNDGDEVAFMPPVSGGTCDWRQVIEDDEGHFFAITADRIDAQALASRLVEGRDGAVVTFDGVVRNNSKGRETLYLEYEAYEPMAVQVMARVGREVASAHGISRIGIIHRVGRLEIGESSIVVVVTSPHRKAAFEACAEAMDRVKKLVPVWKKEHFADGETWVEGAWDDSVSGS
ncbi:MAG: molybdopterin converting factor subunit 1 [Bryobacteraceae bacterium]|nr:molybdopterin converting factor subunit 1 [Bryobacteraceae bacterium]